MCVGFPVRLVLGTDAVQASRGPVGRIPIAVAGPVVRDHRPVRTEEEP